MKQILPSELVPFDLVAADNGMAVDLVYAKPHHSENIFGPIYHPKARMWGHIDMVVLVALAARHLRKTKGWTLVVKDCLRPVEAQQKILMTKPVLQHPEWLDEGGFLSSPGKGGHPRGMAVDLAAIDKAGMVVDFGTPFDAFAASPLPELNPAHRQHPHISGQVQQNRKTLDDAMCRAAERMGRELILLQSEWWDFRFPSSETSEYAPLKEDDLEPWQFMTKDATANPPKGREEALRLDVAGRLQKLGDL